MQEKEILVRRPEISYVQGEDSSLDYRKIENADIKKKHKMINSIKILGDSNDTITKRIASSTDGYPTKKRKCYNSDSSKINFRYPKVIDFLFTRPCDEIIKNRK